MFYSIRHVTRFVYSLPVTESVSEVRMQPRSEGNQRRYSREVLRRVAVIKVAQRIGISLASIHDALSELPESRTPTVADWARLSARWKAELDDRIARLVQLREQLGDCIGCGCLSLAVCKLRNPLDELSESGSGPRLLAPGS